MADSWQCPYCGTVSIPSNRVTLDRVDGTLQTDLHARGTSLSLDFYFRTTLTQCPSRDCQKYEIRAEYGPWIRSRDRAQRGVPIREWRLVPSSAARVLPDYVPPPIREDYEEACAIVEASPKAAASLARRALQGMIRDFWGVTERDLYHEIDALEDKVETATWRALDGLRRLGNIGAHMEKGINVIVDVDEGEAAKLIELIEMLIDDWYVARREREERVASIIKIADSKDEDRAKQKAANAIAPGYAKTDEAKR